MIKLVVDINFIPAMPVQINKINSIK